MPIVSVTRMRVRSTSLMPLFLIHARRAIAQIRKAEGHLAGAVKRDGNFAYWTMSVWRDENAIQAYVSGGAHRTAMSHLRNWGIEASMVRWAQNETNLPDWPEAARRLRKDGRAAKLEHPGPDHADRTWPKPTGGSDLRF